MLSNISTLLTQVLSKYNDYSFTKQQVDLLSRILKMYNKEIVPIDVVKDNLHINYEEVNNLMIYLARNNIIKLNYKVWCDNPNCNADTEVYENIYDIPMEECESCDKKCKKVNNIYIVYRVFLNE